MLTLTRNLSLKTGGKGLRHALALHPGIEEQVLSISPSTIYSKCK